ncbi:malonyl CoA-acyl carrier protein transacylase [Streptomyces zhaozhouensis]|uniref:[acyl-carrier-protein] S-malonyltransferase n=1 Tax=Streptomyces zhaozhouensis TaxID=1300267 RepID=A0A286E037_9ACTN|nr:ACP S-malonyltransferase [Streptomyces zhaozhouensis]SOD64269.1 malonyl CoA-acyl carrier protein transacylase [Streptomyces zhaozhouensis]
MSAARLDDRPTTVFLCGGQGSQFFGMAASLHRENAAFRASADEWDAHCRERHGLAPLDYVHDPARGLGDPCDDLALTNAALFLTEYSLARALRADGIRPDVLVGASLGEFVALAVAGRVTPGDALDFLIGMAGVVTGRAPAGGMLAVLGDPALHATVPELREGTEIASVNHEGHFVLTGTTEGLAAAERALRERDLVTVSLPVRFPFHSAALDPLAGDVGRLAAALTVAPPAEGTTVISSATGQPVTELTPDHCWRALREPIAFTRALSSVPVAGGPVAYVDLTPSATLAAVMRVSHPDRKTYPVITPFGNERANLAQLGADAAAWPRPRAAEPERGRRTQRGSTMIGALFPGQGAQAKGMGEKEFARFPELVRQADEILGYSIEDLCLNNPDERLNETRYTQVALYVVSALEYLAWEAEGNKADYFAGHSVGEYAALLAAGGFDFATGLKLVKRRAELMSRAAGGGMAAVSRIPEDEVRAVLATHRLSSLDIANLNTPRQTVISGPREDVEKAKELFDAAGGSYTVLKVSGAFHSRYMAEASQAFSRHVGEFGFTELRTPVVSNLRARPYRNGEIARVLSWQITSPVKWTESVRYMMGKGVETFVQVGPGKTAANMAKQIVRLAEPLVVDD